MSEFYEEIFEIQPRTWLILALLILAGLLVLITNLRTKWNARMLAVGAICLAASFVLSYLRLFRLPQGGSVTVMSTLPIMIFIYLYGLGPGLIIGLAYSILQLIQEPYILSFAQFVLDYPMSFMVLGIGAVCAKLPGKDVVKFPLCVILGGFLRMVSSFLSGYLFFAEYAPEGMHPALYSFLYNFTSVGLDTLICAIGAALLAGTGLLAILRKTTARSR